MISKLPLRANGAAKKLGGDGSTGSESTTCNMDTPGAGLSVSQPGPATRNSHGRRFPGRLRPPQPCSNPAVTARARDCAPGRSGMPSPLLQPGRPPTGPLHTTPAPAWAESEVRNRKESGLRAEPPCGGLRRRNRSCRLRVAAALRVPARLSAARSLPRLPRPPWPEASTPIPGRRRGPRS